MAAGVLIGGAVISGIGAVKKYSDTKKAGEVQSGLDAQNIALRNREVDESIRRTKVLNRETESEVANQVGGSGFGKGSSLDKYLTSIKGTHKRDEEWMRTSGDSQSAISEREASARARNTRAQATGGLISGIGSSVMSASGGFKW